jgi:hypothetical protein
MDNQMKLIIGRIRNPKCLGIERPDMKACLEELAL